MAVPLFHKEGEADVQRGQGICSRWHSGGDGLIDKSSESEFLIYKIKTNIFPADLTEELCS